MHSWCTGEWTTTGGAEQLPFLRYDSGPQSANRTTVFATDVALLHLARSDTWFMDGTFATPPGIYEQLYIIRAPLRDSGVTCVYAFLSRKTPEIYEEMLRAVVEACESLSVSPDPTSIMIDFKSAMKSAIPKVLGSHVDVQCCFYHLTQSTKRKVQSIGLMPWYRADDQIKLYCGMLDALAFVPVNLVDEGMTIVKRNMPPHACTELLNELTVYFDETYVTGTFRQILPQSTAGANGSADPVPTLRMRRIPPLHPPPIWNVHEITLAGKARTNNLCEGWNNSFRHLIGHGNPSICRSLMACGRIKRWLQRHCSRRNKGCLPRSAHLSSRKDTMIGFKPFAKTLCPEGAI